MFKYLSDMMNPERSGGGDRTASLELLREEENRLESLLLELSSSGSEDSAALEAITNQLCDIGEQLDMLENQTTETVESLTVGASDAECMADTILSWVREYCSDSDHSSKFDPCSSSTMPLVSISK